MAVANVRRPLPVAAIIVAAAAVSVFGSSTTAGAAQPSCGALSHYFEGKTQSSVSGDWGTQAAVVRRPAQLCSSDSSPNSNFSTPWVMLREVSLRSPYMQAGYMVRPGDCAPEFTEHDRDGTGTTYPFRRTFGPCVTFGTTETYTVLFDTTCGCSWMGYGLNVLDTTEYSILGEWSNSRSDYLAETTHNSSDIPGTSATPAAMQALRVQRPFATSFTANTAALSDLASYRYHHSALYLNSFTFWTDPL